MAGRSESEVGVEPDGDTLEVCDPLHANENSGHERGAVDGVVADREGLSGGAEDDFLIGDRTDHPHAMDPNASRADVIRFAETVMLNAPITAEIS